MENQGWQMLWFVFFDPKSQSPGEAALLQHSRLAFSRYLVDSEWLAWWALWEAPWTRQPRKLLLSSHLIQHIPCLEARSTNEVGDWKMVGWVVIVIQLYCCTPIWLWHALAKNSASFSSPIWFDGHFGRKDTLLSGRAHLYFQVSQTRNLSGNPLGRSRGNPKFWWQKNTLVSFRFSARKQSTDLGDFPDLSQRPWSLLSARKHRLRRGTWSMWGCHAKIDPFVIILPYARGRNCNCIIYLETNPRKNSTDFWIDRWLDWMITGYYWMIFLGKGDSHLQVGTLIAGMQLLQNSGEQRR